MIYLGMKEEQVVERLGPPHRVVGTKRYQNGVVEVRHYVVNRISHLEDTGSKKEYYLYFWNGELVRWDQPDEWETEAHRLMRTLGR